MVEDNKKLFQSIELQSTLNSYILLSSLIAAQKLNLFDAIKSGNFIMERYCSQLEIDIDRLKPIIGILYKYEFLSIKNESIELSSKAEEFCNPMNSWISLLKLIAEDYLPASLKIYESLFLSETAYEISHGSNPWDKRSNSKIGVVFDSWLDSETRKSAKEISDYLERSKLLNDSFLDIGGGMGSVSQEVKNIRPDIFVALFELPEVISRIKESQIRKSFLTLDLYIAGNFFEDIPRGYDLLFMKSILHDFNDDSVLRILANIRNNKHKESRICIVERCFDEGTLFNIKNIIESDLLELNFLMSVVHGSKERSEFEWNKLFEAAGFRINSLAVLKNGYSVFELI